MVQCDHDLQLRSDIAAAHLLEMPQAVMCRCKAQAGLLVALASIAACSMCSSVQSP